MKRLRLRAKEKAFLRDIGTETIELISDHARRFRNALLCLVLNDPKWMIWVERNLPRDGIIQTRDLILIESRARALVLKNYGWFGRRRIGDLLFRHDWAFTDRGSLSPG